MKSVAIEARDLWFSYAGPPVLEDVNLTIHEGAFLAVIGPNGGGKTTLVKLILGILKPDRGEILVFGKHPHRVSHLVGYVPQDTHINREFPISAMDVALMGRLSGAGGKFRYSGQDRELTREALEQMGMWKYRNRRIGDLSGGQIQRVFIARALAAQPRILIMDEPTSSVDTQGQTELYEFLKELNKTMTIVIVTHDISVLHTYIESVACVAQTLHFHDRGEITPEMMEKAYPCAVELLAHGIPHRVLADHEDKS